MTARRATVQRLTAGMRVCICAGSGGVGKTTTAAALAMGLAMRGQRVAVVTIDPARRLADSLGVDDLGNEPRRIDPALFERHGVLMRGELWAMMLDPKRTMDELIDGLAPDDSARDEVLSNRIYQGLSAAVAGSQEFSAMSKLYELDRSGAFDVIVLDTPPSRNALDFLDAPGRLTQFLDGRALRVFLAPSGIASRLVGRGTGMVFAVLRRLTGSDLLSELSTFFRALSGLLDGFSERAAGAGELLRDPSTTFLMITSPEPEPVEEALFFAAKLAEAGMPFGGLIVNRVSDERLLELDPADCAALLQESLGLRLAERVAANLADFRALAERDRLSIRRLSDELGERSPVLVPELDGDVHEIGGLLRIERELFGPDDAAS